MRVVSGTYRGRQLLTLGGTHTRPTTGKVREAVFSSLSGEVAGAVWLDLFSGSGAMGIEALSRGASYCFFVDNSHKACAIIQKNLASLGIGKDKARLYCTDAEKACLLMDEYHEAIHIAYLDPPYGDESLYTPVIKRMEPLLAASGLLIIEHQRGWLPEVQWCDYLKTRTYGFSAVSFFRKG